jgi:hypothetical protein
MSEWVSVDGKGYRKTDVEFEDGVFKELMLDYQGDYSHSDEIPHVTHWMPLPEPPKAKL